jgi:Tfp pilus assembly protein PilE
MRQRGFTVLELIVAAIVIIAAGTIFYMQERNWETALRDNQAKTSINAIYYNLEYVYFSTNHSYPQFLTADQLPGLDPNTLKDPDSKKIGDQTSAYRYEPKDCTAGKCKSYTLTANLRGEADFVKKSLN